MASGNTKKKTTKEQRRLRSYRLVFVIISIIVLATMILSLVAR